MHKESYEQSENYTVENKALEESLKIEYDLIKHLTTLDTGAILIILTLLEKVFTKPSEKGYLIFSIVCFIFSIISSVFTLFLMPVLIRDIEKPTVEVSTKYGIVSLLMFLSGIGFIFGIIMFCVFALRQPTS